ncbi:unnamed protein product [Acanthosepion pharaonis]|uniref:DUF7041 domain-containing protein n=1 Tax=Acanthosepion pharaonis TaxID=158019 RepID=A0A812DD54_ACAPH|nr:unnamed protein product [Sepia pharaonis]
MAEPTTISETAIKLEMPAFNANVQTWFLQLDAIFQARRITSQQSKFAAVVEKLPAEIAAEVADILTSVPVEKPYEILKEAILHRSGFSEEKRIRELLSNVTTEDTKPSQLLRRMQQLLGENDISTTVFKQMWLDKLPPEVVRILAALADDVDIQKLAIIADKITDTAPIKHISATNTGDGLMPDIDRQIQKLSTDLQEISIQLRGLQNARISRRENYYTKRNKQRWRSNSRHKYQRQRNEYPNEKCWYHENFGAQANKCKQSCSYKKPPTAKQQGNGHPGTQ